MAGVINPGRRDVGLLSTVMKGLAIARDVYGIKTDMAKLDAMDAQEKERIEQQAAINSEKSRIARGEMTKGEYNKALMGGQIEPAKEGDNGAFGVTVIGDEGPILAHVKKAGQGPLQRAVDPVAARKLALEEKRFAWEQEQAKSKADANKNAGAGGGTKPLKDLPPDQQIAVKKLATDNATRTSIVNQMEAEYKKFLAAEGDEDMQVKIGEGMLKLLNSPFNPDAIGNEEAGRVGGFLKYQKGNLAEPGAFWGRDLSEFKEQVRTKIDSVKDGVASNQAIVDDLLGRKSGPKAGDIVEVDGKQYKVAENGDDLIPIGAVGSN